MIILMGSVGSGKSEQGIRMQKWLKVPLISSSDVIRNNLTPEREAKMAEGTLIEDDEIIELIEPEINNVGPADHEFILDGFPRTLPQAEWLVDKIDYGLYMFTAIIKLDVAEEVVQDRMRLRNRLDDRAEVMARRLETYKNVTTPLVDYFRQKGFVVNEIDGELPPHAVEEQIKKVLG